jgi:hypothetical protein
VYAILDIIVLRPWTVLDWFILESSVWDLEGRVLELDGSRDWSVVVLAWTYVVGFLWYREPLLLTPECVVRINSAIPGELRRRHSGRERRRLEVMPRPRSVVIDILYLFGLVVLIGYVVGHELLLWLMEPVFEELLWDDPIAWIEHPFLLGDEATGGFELIEWLIHALGVVDSRAECGFLGYG